MYLSFDILSLSHLVMHYGVHVYLLSCATGYVFMEVVHNPV